MEPTLTSSPTHGLYAGWTREALIQRLEQLEQASGVTPGSTPPAVTPPAPIAAPHAAIPTPSTPSKSFDFTRHARRKIAIKFCYSGWEYGGLAFQSGPTPLPTVENVMFDAMAKARLVDPEAGFEGCEWDRCGRTDRGVSAGGQVVSLWIRSALGVDQIEGASSPPSASPTTMTTTAKEEFDYVYTMNRILPPTIRVIAWSPVASTFSARFSCRYRHYKYLFAPDNLSIPLMQDAASRLVGEHDFRNMCKIDPAKQITVFKRRVISAHLEQLDDGLYVFNLVGSAFLYHQVRNIMAVLFMVGSGLEKPSIVTKLMNVEDGDEPMREEDRADEEGQAYLALPRRPDYQMADGLPLMLWECGYDPSELSWRTCGSVNGETNPDLYNQMQAIHSRSRILAALDQHFALSVAAHHAKPLSPFPLANGLADLPRDGQPLLYPLGGGTFKRVLKYVPVMQRKRGTPAEEQNERWRRNKGSRKLDESS